mmetsp:Transcript_24383/g.59164  ORF Transcript_24383/g.59164 Transcript_24383/m.59164 type:complete len:201 (+) Transcript_24383:45-647(+)
MALHRHASRTAVLCVDLQEAWVGDSSPLHQVFPNFRPAVTRLFAWARGASVPLVHIRARYTLEDSPWVPNFTELNPEKPSTSVTPDAASFAKELEGEPIVFKPTFDGFLNTDLDEVLRKNEVEHVVVCGCITSACVMMTTYGAFARGYRVTLVEDACADRSADRQAALLSLYSDYVFRVASSQDLDKVLLPPYCSSQVAS